MVSSKCRTYRDFFVSSNALKSILINLVHTEMWIMHPKLIGISE